MCKQPPIVHLASSQEECNHTLKFLIVAILFPFSLVVCYLFLLFFRGLMLPAQTLLRSGKFQSTQLDAGCYAQKQTTHQTTHATHG